MMVFRTVFLLRRGPRFLSTAAANRKDAVLRQHTEGLLGRMAAASHNNNSSSSHPIDNRVYLQAKLALNQWNGRHTSVQLGQYYGFQLLDAVASASTNVQGQDTEKDALYTTSILNGVLHQWSLEATQDRGRNSNLLSPEQVLERLQRTYQPIVVPNIISYTIWVSTAMKWDPIYYKDAVMDLWNQLVEDSSNDDGKTCIPDAAFLGAVLQGLTLCDDHREEDEDQPSSSQALDFFQQVQVLREKNPDLALHLEWNEKHFSILFNGLSKSNKLETTFAVMDQFMKDNHIQPDLALINARMRVLSQWRTRVFADKWQAAEQSHDSLRQALQRYPDDPRLAKTFCLTLEGYAQCTYANLTDATRSDRIQAANRAAEILDQLLQWEGPKLSGHSAVACGAAVGAYCRVGLLDDAVALFDKLTRLPWVEKGSNAFPNSHSLAAILMAIPHELEHQRARVGDRRRTAAAKVGQYMFDQSLEHCLPEAPAWGMLIKLWSKASSHKAKSAADQARNVLHQMKESGVQPTEQCYASVLNAYARIGDSDAVEELITEMHRANMTPNVHLSNMVLVAWSNDSRPNRKEQAPAQCTAFLEQMNRVYKESGSEECRPNVLSYASVIHCWAKADPEKHPNLATRAQQLFDTIQATTGDEPDGSAHAGLVEAYCKVGNMDEALQVARNLLTAYQESKDEALRPRINIFYRIVDGYQKMIQETQDASLVDKVLELENQLASSDEWNLQPHDDCEFHNRMIECFKASARSRATAGQEASNRLQQAMAASNSRRVLDVNVFGSVILTERMCLQAFPPDDVEVVQDRIEHTMQQAMGLLRGLPLKFRKHTGRRASMEACGRYYLQACRDLQTSPNEDLLERLQDTLDACTDREKLKENPERALSKNQAGYLPGDRVKIVRDRVSVRNGNKWEQFATDKEGEVVTVERVTPEYVIYIEEYTDRERRKKNENVELVGTKLSLLDKKKNDEDSSTGT